MKSCRAAGSITAAQAEGNAQLENAVFDKQESL